LLSDEGKVGLDIEVMRARGGQQKRLQDQFQTPAESAWISAQYDRLEAETQLWSIRQSVLKISGLGNSGQSSLLLHPFSGHLRSSITPQVQVMSDADEYLSWACAREPSLERLVCWQYEANKGLQKNGEISPRAPASSTRFIKLTSLALHR
jgi:phosphopantetheinyl transferase